MNGILRFSDGDGHILKPFADSFFNLSDIHAVQVLDSRLSTLGTNSFNGCVNLSAADLVPVTSIGYRSFKNCANLVSVKTSFDDVRCLNSLYRDWGISCGCSCYTVSSDIPVITVSGLFDYYISPRTGGERKNDGFYSVKAYTMCDTDSTCEISSITFCDGVSWSDIQTNAFYNAVNLKKIELPASISAINRFALYNIPGSCLVVNHKEQLISCTTISETRIGLNELNGGMERAREYEAELDRIIDENMEYEPTRFEKEYMQEVFSIEQGGVC